MCLFCVRSGSRGRRDEVRVGARARLVTRTSSRPFSWRHRGRRDDRREGGARSVRVARRRWRRDACARTEDAPSPSCQSVRVCFSVSCAVKCARRAAKPRHHSCRVFVFGRSFSGREEQRAVDGLILESSPPVVSSVPSEAPGLFEKTENPQGSDKGDGVRLETRLARLRPAHPRARGIRVSVVASETRHREYSSARRRTRSASRVEVVPDLKPGLGTDRNGNETSV